MFDETTSVETQVGCDIVPGLDAYRGFYDEKAAQEHAKVLATANPKGKVVMFVATGVIEPRRIEFAEKKYNDAGELIV